MPGDTGSRVLRAIRRRRGELIALTTALVRTRSELGAEEEAQRLVEHRLRVAGFTVERIQPQGVLEHPLAGYPILDYAGRTCVAGRVGGPGGRSLHLSGHVDVVPVECLERWSIGPWSGEIRDGRIWGRGAGDMKGGLAAYLVAAEAVLEVCGPPRGELIFSSVIEEECGGNGMLAVLTAGYESDATLIGEPTGLTLDHGGVGVIWCRLVLKRDGTHAAAPERAGDGPIDSMSRVIYALRELERRLNNDAQEDVFQSASPHPYVLNLGAIHGGLWPSSEPAAVTLDVRVGFGPDRQPAEVQQLVRETVASAGLDVQVEFRGFRAPAYYHDPQTAFARTLSRHHETRTSEPLSRRVSTATTDARWVAEQCYCYGPIAGQIHGIDEWVDVQSLEVTAEVVGSTIVEWCEFETHP